MNPESGVTSGQSPETQPLLSGGLYLKGTVIAIRTVERQWEKKSWTETVCEISDGEQVYAWRHKHDGKPFHAPKVFTQVRLRVNYANSEKGKISVQGYLL